jgi:8-oxo-dGTP diphosphatase
VNAKDLAACLLEREDLHRIVRIAAFRRLDDETFEVLVAHQRSGRLELPGGHVSSGEDDSQAASRELREETGIDFPADQLLRAAEIRGDDGIPNVIYAVQVPSTYAVTAGSDVRALDWVPVKQLPSLTMQHEYFVKAAFRRYYGMTESLQASPSNYFMNETRRAGRPIRSREVIEGAVTEDRQVFTSKFIYDLNKAEGVDKVVDIWSQADGSAGLVRMKDGQAYEVVVRPASSAKSDPIARLYTQPDPEKLKRRKMEIAQRRSKFWGNRPLFK